MWLKQCELSITANVSGLDNIYPKYKILDTWTWNVAFKYNCPNATSNAVPERLWFKVIYSTTFQTCIRKKFTETRPKPAYSRQGLDSDRWARIQFSQVYFGAKTWKPWKPTKKHEKTMKLRWKPCKPTKNHEKPWNHLEKPIQLTSIDPKMSRYLRGTQNDLLWSKNVTLLTRDPKWPPLIQKRHVTYAGPQLIF